MHKGCNDRHRQTVRHATVETKEARAQTGELLHMGFSIDIQGLNLSRSSWALGARDATLAILRMSCLGEFTVNRR